MKTILITGANGFIGKHVVQYFLDNTDWQIVTIDKRGPSDKFGDRAKRIIWWSTNLINQEQASLHQDQVGSFYTKGDLELKKLKTIDYVIHLAAEKHVKNSYKEIEPYIINNVLGSARLFNWLRDKGCEKIINFSTAAVLGPSDEFVSPSEGSPYNPHNPYAGSKAAQEAIATAYSNTYKLPIINVRIDTPFGKGQPEDNLIPFMIKRLIKGETIKLYGKNAHGDNGFTYCSRNWIYAEDIPIHLYDLLENPNERINKKFYFDARFFSSRNYHLIGNKYNVYQIYKKISNYISSVSKTENLTVDENATTQDNHLHYSLGCIYNDTKKSRLTEEEFDKRIKETVDYFIRITHTTV